MIHVYPIADLREHKLEGRDCWCRPDVDEDEGIVTHYSLDGRESYQTGELLPQ